MFKVEVSDGACKSEDAYRPPKLSDKGRILVRIYENPEGPAHMGGVGVEPYDHDEDTSVMWLNHGVGVDYWISSIADDVQPGFWVYEGVHGQYFKGAWGYDDDDEEWYYDSVRRATLLERYTGELAGNLEAPWYQKAYWWVKAATMSMCGTLVWD